MRGRVIYEYEASRPMGVLWAILLGGLVLAALVGFLLLGAVVLTIALWIGLGAAVVALVVAIVRGLFGAGRNVPPR